jgi:hypothetical protein
MLKEFFWPDKSKLAIFALLLILMFPVSDIGAATLERADSPSSEQPLLESLEAQGRIGQLIVDICALIYLFLIFAPWFLFTFITGSAVFLLIARNFFNKRASVK